jgi:hypothetical protein
MGDETRKLLKIFGVAVTDFEAEAAKLTASAAAVASKEDALALLGNANELCRELNQRWMEITKHVFAAQERLLTAVAPLARPPAT